MNQVFWGLKDNWWKQVYDGKFHPYGNNVFDRGLHGGIVEPGYYKSIKLACEYASERLGDPLTFEIYQRIHQVACGHFSMLCKPVIIVDKAKIDHFRDASCCCNRNLVHITYASEDRFEKKRRRLSFAYLHSIRSHLKCEHQIRSETGSKEELASLSDECKLRVIEIFSKTESRYREYGIDIRGFLENGNPFYEEAIESTREVMAQLKRTQERFNFSKPFAELKINATYEETIVSLHYLYCDPVEIEQVLRMLLDEYNEQMQTLPPNAVRSSEENKYALTLIAELFQNLEWLHPFFDGQGRTDLVLLSKLLTENGFNPAILYQPYLSTFEPLEKWIDYLENGIEAWKKELENIVDSYG